MRGFDVSWISRYGPQEQERYEKYIMTCILFVVCCCWFISFRLFFGNPGNDHPLNISCILIVSTASNLKKLITPLTILDNILSDNVSSFHDNTVPNNRSHFSVLSSLFSFVLESKKESKYIYKTFNSFRKNKTVIKIHIHRLNVCCHNKDLLSLLFYKLVFDSKFNGSFKSVHQNVIKAEVLSIFPNVQYLEIYCQYYPFSLDSLLSVITGTSINKVVIEDGQTWLNKVIESNEFKKENWRLKFNGYGTLIISSK